MPPDPSKDAIQRQGLKKESFPMKFVSYDIFQRNEIRIFIVRVWKNIDGKEV
jgi:hypothetical protein